jgi:hypothetical protein
LIQRNNVLAKTRQYGEVPPPWQWENAGHRRRIGKNRALQKYNRAMDL